MSEERGDDVLIRELRAETQSLRAEVERLKIKLDRSREINGSLNQLIDLVRGKLGLKVGQSLTEAIDTLAALVGELEKDKARLEWLGKRGVAWRDCYHSYAYPTWEEGEWFYHHSESPDIDKNLRTAIDVAMKEAE